MWRRWGTPQNFFLAFIDELKKQIICKKTVKWANKKQNNFNIYIQCYIFFFKKKKNTCRYHYQSLDDIIYRSSDIEHNILKLVILGYFLPFYPPKNSINQNFEKMKNFTGKTFTHVYQKNYNHVQFLRYRVRQTISCHFGSFCALLTKFWKMKNEKNAWRYYPFINTCAPKMKIIWYMVPEV